MSFFPNQAIGLSGSVIPLYSELMGGSDGTNLRPLLTDNTGQLKVLVENFPATQPVSIAGTVTITGAVTLASTTITGTVAVTQSTSPWVVSLTSTTITGTVAENLTQVAGTALGATGVTAFGTAPAAVNVPGVNASLFAGTTALTATAGALNVVATALGTYNSAPPVLANAATSSLQLDSSGSEYVDSTGRISTYRCAVRSFVPVASSTSPLFSIQGSATKTVRVRSIKISWYCTTGNALGNGITLQRFSVLTGGTTGNTPTLAADDTANPAGTAVVLQYSTVPSTATAVGGFISSEMMFWQTSGAAAADGQPVFIEFRFGELGAQALTLRGLADYLGLMISAVGTLLPIMTVRACWTEE